MYLLNSRVFYFGFFYLTTIYAQDDILEYECSNTGANTGVIAVTNPDPSVYIWAQVNASTHICNTTLIGDKIFIYDCYNKSLTMLLSNENGLPVIITSIIKNYRLSCVSLPYEGVTKKVVDDTHVTNLMSTSIQPTVLIEIVLNTSLVDIDTGLQRSTATMGEQFYWYIWGPENYIIMPYQCSAYSGLLADTTTYSVDTHTNACTLENSLLSDFRLYNTSKHLVVADLFVFRFPDNDQLRLHCNVLVCPPGSTYCDFNCTDDRRRRSEDDDKLEGMVSWGSGHKTPPQTTPRTTPLVPGATVIPVTTSIMRQKRSRNDIARGQVETQIQVIGEPTVFVEELSYGSSVCLTSQRVFVLVIAVFAHIIFLRL